MKGNNYLLSFLLSFLGLSLFVAVVNFLVDPYLMLGSPRHQGFNAHKVEINENVRLSKAYHPLQATHDTLLVGNSRVEMGLDPNHACLIQSGARPYNLGVPGAGVKRQLEFALNAIYQQPVKRVFLSVDFVDFLIAPGEPARVFEAHAPSGNFRYTFSGEANPEFISSRFLDYYRALFSLDAFFASTRTVAFQSNNAPDRTELGLNPARDMDKVVAIEGPRALFTQKMYVLQNKYSRRWTLNYADGSRSMSFEALAAFLTIAEKEGVQVILFTNPFHQDFWNLLREKGLYQLHQKWLEEITAIAALGADTQLWDFSADSPYIHEEVPAASVKSGPLKWFWEPAHYRRELGDVMLNSMLAETCGAAPRFGKRLH